MQKPDNGSLVDDSNKASERKNHKPVDSSYDLIRLYFQEINRFEVLPAKEQIALAIQVRESDDEAAAQKLVVSNLKLVVKIAMDFQKHWSKNLLDLIQEGNLGLLQAVKKFNPYREIKFSYYASFWINAYILKFIMNNWKLVKIGTSQPQRKLFFKLNKERQDLIAQGISPEPELLAERLDVPEKDVIEMSQRLASWDLSLHAPLGQNTNEEYGNIVPDPVKNIEQRLSEHESYNLLSEKLQDFRETLSERDAYIFDHRILAEDHLLTLREIGDRFGISRERVRQLQIRIILRIQDYLKQKIQNFETDYSECFKHAGTQ